MIEKKESQLRKILFLIFSIFTVNTFGTESSIDCEMIRDVLNRVENVSSLSFKHDCVKLDETDLFILSYSTYEHRIEVDFGDISPSENKFSDEYVMFDKRVVTGGLQYMNLIEDSINEGLNNESAVTFALYRTIKPMNKDYQGIYILKKFLK